MQLNTWFESLLLDLRYGIRGFARNPIFTLTAIFAAALGIGATTAVFSVVDRVLFRSLPYPAEDRLVSVGIMAPLDTTEFLFAGPYLDWRRHQTPFQSITSFTAGVADCDLTRTIRRGWVAPVWKRISCRRSGCRRCWGEILQSKRIVRTDPGSP